MPRPLPPLSLRPALIAVLAGVLSSACRSDAQPDVYASERPERYEPQPVLDDGSGGRWDYLLAETPHMRATEPWDGRYNGPTTLWRSNGTKREEGSYRGDRKEGPWTFWYANGSKRWEGTYRNGRPEGKETAWYENGNRFYEGEHRGNQREGWFTFWYANGRKWFEGEYRGGAKQGFFRYWNEDGSVDRRKTGTYVHGRKVSD